MKKTHRSPIGNLGGFFALKKRQRKGREPPDHFIRRKNVTEILKFVVIFVKLRYNVSALK